jgi:LysR family glycine cleavage system transcriptional activator
VANNISHSDPAHRYVLDRSSMAIQLAMDGAGVVLESLALAQNAIEDGRLVPFSSAYPAMRFGSYWIVCPERHLKRKSVTAFMNWIRDKSDVYDAGVKHRLAQLGIKFTKIDARDFRPQA